MCGILLQVLSDENKKQQYDTFGMSGGGGMGAGTGGHPGAGFSGKTRKYPSYIIIQHPLRYDTL